MRGTSLLAVLAAVLVARVQSQKYFITSSKYARPNLNYDIDVSLDSSINSDVMIKARITGTTSYREPSKEIASGQVTISPPKVKETLSLMMDKLTSEYYQVWLTLEGSGAITFNETKTLQVEKKTLSIFIQTDKAIYKPGQTVKARVMAVDMDTKPYTQPMKIEVFDSKNNKIKSMKNLQNPPYYVNGFNITLSTQPNLGIWKIKAEAGGEKVEKDIEIAEYVLPKFEVSIECPKYKLFDGRDLKCTVVAKYTFGQNVEGNSTVYIDLDYYSSSYYGVKRGMLVKKFTLKNGRADFTLSEFEILDMKFDPDYCVPRRFREETRQCHIDAFRGDGQYMPSTTIKMMANVTNKLTGTTLSGDVALKIETSSIKAEFLPVTPGNFKRSQVYSGVLQIQQIVSEPLDESFLPMKVLVKAELTGESEVKYRSGPRWDLDIGMFDVDMSGLVPIQFTVPENATSFNLVANVTDPKTRSRSKRFIVARKYNIKEFESGSNTTMQIQILSKTGTVQPDTEERFLIKSNKEIPSSFHYTILGKGSVAATGVFTVAATQIPMVEDSPLYRYEFSISFTTELAQKIAPAARIIVYFLTESGKLIVDTIDFNVEGGIANKVSCEFSTNQTKPGESLEVSVAAAPNSFIGLLAVDVSVLALKGGNDITENDLTSELKMYDPSQRYITPYPFWGGWGRWRRSSYGWWWPPTTGGDDTAEVLDRAGLLVFTDAYVHEKEEDYRNYPRYGSPGGRVANSGLRGEAGPTGPSGRVGPAGPMGERGQGGSPGGAPAGPAPRPKPLKPAGPVRKAFPETWIWADELAGTDGMLSLPVKAPDTITSWVLSAFAINTDVGMGVAPVPSKLTVFKPFFVSLNLPYSVIMGEMTSLKITVFNYMKSKQDVTLTVVNDVRPAMFKAYQNGVEEEPTDMNVVKKLTVPANGGMTVSVWIRPLMLGNINLTVLAQSSFASDGVRRKLLVEPPGVEEVAARSMLVNSTSDSSTTTVTMPVEIPRGKEFFVEGSEFIKVTAIGDIMGKVLANLGSLVKMPYGCGEQNMINFAPNIFVRKYLEATDQLTMEFRDKTTTYMEAGYQRELSYQHDDGSFSAFGGRDNSGSTWLTAFVLKSYGQAKSFIEVDVENIKKPARFIMSQIDRTTGTFREPGSVHNTRLVGGSTSNGKAALTAYILISLLQNEDILDTPDFKEARLLATQYLESQIEAIKDNSYTMAITYYALTMAKSPVRLRLQELLLSKMKAEDGTIHWEEDKAPQPPKSRGGWRRSYHQARSTDIEMTAYAMLGLLSDQDMEKCLQIMKWLVKQQNAFGGYSSTQDTVIALQALSELAEKIYGNLNCVSDSLDINVTPIINTVKGQTMSFSPIKKSNSLVLQSIELPKDTTDVTITTRQCGFALVQVQYSYNVKEAEDDDDIDVTVTSLVDEFKQVIVNTCTKWRKGGGETSGMGVLEVAPLSGFEIISDGLLEKYKSKGVKRVETELSKLVIYLDEIPEAELCMEVPMEKVNDVSNLQESKVSVYSYYQPNIKKKQFYLPTALANVQPCDACPDCCVQGPEPPVIVNKDKPGVIGGVAMATVTITTLVLSIATVIFSIII